jgi:hypothetical protein
MSGESNAGTSPKDDREQASAPDEIVLDPGPACAAAGTRSGQSLAEPKFAAALRTTDLAAAPLIEGAKQACRSHHRFCTEIAVAGTKALLSFEEIPNWEDQAREGLTKSGNDGVSRSLPS